MEKKCKVVPIKNDDGVLCRCPSEESKDDIMLREFIDDFEFILKDGGSFEHLYILSDEEIKVGDWILYKHSITGTEWSLHKVINPKYSEFEKAYEIQIDTGWAEKAGCKKIIASTDPSLNVARPSNEFLKAYCRKGGIDEVMVECEMYCPRCEVNGFNIGCTEVHIPRLKVAPDNTVTIRKVKDSWSKEEVINLLRSLHNEQKEQTNQDICYLEIEDWIKENL